MAPAEMPVATSGACARRPLYCIYLVRCRMYDDEVSWTTCTWSALMAQRMSVALHMAAAWEIARELSLAGAEDEAALFGGGVADSVA